jgi:SAM-dependent methyltransferase
MLIHSLAMCLGYVGPLAEWKPDHSLVVLETSGYRAHPELLKCKFRYLNLIFEGMASECLLGDVARLPLGDQTVDAVISSDVFEHVRDDIGGFSEIARVLRPGGYFILEAPAIGELETTRVLVEARGDEDVYVAPPEHHAENTLVYRYYGNDVVDRLSALSLSVLLFRARVPTSLITEQTVVIGQKAVYLSLGPRKPSNLAWT